jgi:hypothetical protein
VRIWAGLGKVLVVVVGGGGSWDHSKKLSGPIKDGEFLYQLSNCYVLKNDPVPVSHLGSQ